MSSTLLLHTINDMFDNNQLAFNQTEKLAEQVILYLDREKYTEYNTLVSLALSCEFRK